MFPPKLPFPIVNPMVIIKVAKKLWSIFFDKDEQQEEVKETISKKASTDIEKTEINDISELNSILMQFSNALQVKANQIEKEIMKECRYFFEDFKELLDSLNVKNSEFTLFKIDRFQRKLEKIESTIYGTMAAYVSRRISLDDEECRRILKILPGNTKKSRMDDFERAVLIEAVNEVATKIKDAMAEFEEQLVQVVEDKMEHINQTAFEKEQILLKLIENTKNNEQQNEEIVFNSMLGVSQALFILKEVRLER